MGNEFCPFPILSSFCFCDHTTLRNRCCYHRHCQCVCGLAPWHLQGCRPSIVMCADYVLLAVRRFSPHPPLLMPDADRGMVCCSAWSVFICVLTYTFVSLP